jgi:hypothetical protein
MRPHRTETSSRRNGTALFTEVEIVLDRGKIRLRFVDLSPYQFLLVHEPVMPEDGCLIVKTLMAPIDNRPHSGGGSHDAPLQCHFDFDGVAGALGRTAAAK